jgi:hypothetical protein
MYFFYKEPFEKEFDHANTQQEYQKIKDRFLSAIEGTDPDIDSIVNHWTN